ncbi:MAG TPA: glutamate 5-kinase [Caldilineaceae bacterium]|nr:glutamate 5-kinase [Caldilineaceae bacterium]
MYKRIVVKLGTSVLTGGARNLDHPRIVELTRQCADLYHAGHDIVVCTSGAQAAGRARLGFPELPHTIANKQMFAAVGQSRLMLTWERFFEIYGIHVGQILITRADVENRQRYLNARDTFLALLEHRIVPIVNENDAVAPEEIKVGDNDNLSALVAMLVNADLLLLLTDQPGLYTADPRSNPDAQLIPEVRKIDETLRQLAGGSVSGLGTGGMYTKLQAVDTARRAGADVIITSGQTPDVILRAAKGETLGTRFPAEDSRLDSRRQWIAAGPKPQGHIVIDEGAVRAICKKGKSLLPAGIRRVMGDFQRGDPIAILALDGHEVARGLSAYEHRAMEQIAGCRSSEISEILGYTYGDVAVHRNDMILFSD